MCGIAARALAILATDFHTLYLYHDRNAYATQKIAVDRQVITYSNWYSKEGKE